MLNSSVFAHTFTIFAILLKQSPLPCGSHNIVSSTVGHRPSIKHEMPRTEFCVQQTILRLNYRNYKGSPQTLTKLLFTAKSSRYYGVQLVQTAPNRADAEVVCYNDSCQCGYKLLMMFIMQHGEFWYWSRVCKGGWGGTGEMFVPSVDYIYSQDWRSLNSEIIDFNIIYSSPVQVSRFYHCTSSHLKLNNKP